MVVASPINNQALSLSLSLAPRQVTSSLCDRVILAKARETAADNHATFLRRFLTVNVHLVDSKRWRRWPILRTFPSLSLSLTPIIIAYYSINAFKSGGLKRADVSSRFRRRRGEGDLEGEIDPRELKPPSRVIK